MNGIEHAWGKLASLLSDPGDIPNAVAAMESAIIFLCDENEADAADLYELWWKAEQINALALHPGTMSEHRRGRLDEVFKEMAAIVGPHVTPAENPVRVTAPNGTVFFAQREDDMVAFWIDGHPEHWEAGEQRFAYGALGSTLGYAIAHDEMPPWLEPLTQRVLSQLGFDTDWGDG